MLRKARLEDLDALVTLEESCFDTDRLSRRSSSCASPAARRCPGPPSRTRGSSTAPA